MPANGVEVNVSNDAAQAVVDLDHRGAGRQEALRRRGERRRALSAPRSRMTAARRSPSSRCRPRPMCPWPRAPELSDLCCYPTSAADAAGNIWFGGSSSSTGRGQPPEPGRRQPNRRRLELLPHPERRTPRAGRQQLPVHAEDDDRQLAGESRVRPPLRRLGRDHDSAISLVISQCDTRPGGVPNAAHCDNADNWSVPATIAPVRQLLPPGRRHRPDRQAVHDLVGLLGGERDPRGRLRPEREELRPRPRTGACRRRSRPSTRPAARGFRSDARSSPSRVGAPRRRHRLTSIDPAARTTAASMSPGPTCEPGAATTRCGPSTTPGVDPPLLG